MRLINAGLESLEKLDLTLNFVGAEFESLESLQKNKNLQYLYDGAGLVGLANCRQVSNG